MRRAQNCGVDIRYLHSQKKLLSGSRITLNIEFLGVYPILECSPPRTDAVSCLSDVSSGKADLVGIDSNYGFLARQYVLSYLI